MRTEKLYVQWIKRFILFHGKRHSLEMGQACRSCSATRMQRRR
ncbi:hypothetical protein [Methylomicrobium sp. Wu6]|nr:hypothetical protein [Methylomicrobium sp. Wu6]